MNTDEHRLKRRQRAGIAAALGVVCVLSLAGLSPQAPVAAQGLGADDASLPGVIEAIDRARNTRRVLYVIAHPDDEGGSVGLLAYLSRHLGADVALLSLTRGEGGQNAVGPEHGPKLAILRTAELEAACQRYGARLFFTRAPDFGYSKTVEETMRIWGPQVVGDMKQVFRTFRPHIIINNWGGIGGGHGHHVASGRLVPRVLDELRAEGDAFWRDAVLLDVFRRGGEGVRIPSDTISPLRGKSYNEIGLEGFVNHRTQGIAGFRGSPFFRSPRTVAPAEGERAITLENFSVPLAEVAILAGEDDAALRAADRAIGAAREAALRLDWAGAVRGLAAAGGQVRDVLARLRGSADPARARLIEELEKTLPKIHHALALAAGLRVDTRTDRSEMVPGEALEAELSWQVRSDVTARLVGIGVATAPVWPNSAAGQERSARITVVVSTDARPTPSPLDGLTPWPAPPVKARMELEVEGYRFAVEQPVVAQRVTSTRAETVPLRVVPAVTVTVEPQQFIVRQAQPPRQLEVMGRVRYHGTVAAEITAGLDAPAGWQVSQPVQLNFTGAGDQLVRFTVTPPAAPQAGSYTLGAWAERAGQRFTTSAEPLPSLPTYLWTEPAEAAVRVFDLSVPAGLRVGYVAAGNDPVPEALRQAGIEVTLLDEVALAFGDLSRFDAIAVGIRAYELRDDLARANHRLLDYAARGGTLVVQYQRESVWNRLHPAPYPAEVGASAGNVRGRVTDENSPVRLLLPDHPLLTTPNKITTRDFDGWVQERGLYFWGQFDARYQAPLALRDPGEGEIPGSLVYARHGEGAYIYTGLAFFRQLPEGVPGAYRLFVNLLSQTKR